MKMTYQPPEGGERKTINIEVTTQHASSSYGQPVLLTPGGELLGAESWGRLEYHIESITRAELDLLRRSLLAWAEVSPVTAAQIAAAKPRAGRPVAEDPRLQRRLTLTDDEFADLREIGEGNASAGVSRLLAVWRQRGK